MNFPKTVGLISLGCSKNRVDSEVLLGQLAKRNVTPVSDPKQAELIVVNTCGFIEPAKEESIDAILEMAQYKKTGQCKLLLVTGCLAQRYSEALKAEMPEVDGFMGVAEYPNVIETIEQMIGGNKPVFIGECARFFQSDRVLTTPKYSAYIKISDGCDNRCTYCAIPLIRGGYHSRPYDQIMDECKTFCAAGVSELTLIAQDTSRYGNDFAQGSLLLSKLLRDISEIEGLHWLRVLYCYPDTVDERLLDTIASLPKASKYLDLPLQHFDAEMLTRMNRRGTPEHIEKLIEQCRARGILTRTTMIVGFPGETQAQFETLLDFVKRAKFARLGAFTYSPEEGTAAADMPGQLDEETKRDRLDQLMMLQQGISQDHNEARIGHVYEVLVERYDGGRYIGRTQWEAPEVDGIVAFGSQRKLKPGQYVKVLIDSADAYDLTGVEVL